MDQGTDRRRRRRGRGIKSGRLFLWLQETKRDYSLCRHLLLCCDRNKHEMIIMEIRCCSGLNKLDCCLLKTNGVSYTHTDRQPIRLFVVVVVVLF